MRIGVLGSGAFGTALAKHLSERGHRTCLWSHRAELAEAIREQGSNERYLPGVPLPDELLATSSLEQALDDCELAVFVVPSHATRELVRQTLALLQHQPLLCCASKGIENGSLALMSEVFEQEIGTEVSQRLTCFSGPSFAKELVARVPTAVTVAGQNQLARNQVQQAFASDRLRVYATEDVVGVEVGGALKNVIAIASGAIDGLGFGLNCRAAVITRGLAEISRLASAKGANPLTMAGLAGMGDLVLTCTGTLSRNYRVGYQLGKGGTLKEILANLGQVAEGVRTTRSAHELGRKLQVEMPITDEVFKVLYEDKPAGQALADLMTRPLKHERA